MKYKTRIALVVDEKGNTVFAPSFGDSGKRPLYEICEGLHTGKRGSHIDIYDLVGRVWVDHSIVSDYKTGAHKEQGKNWV